MSETTGQLELHSSRPTLVPSIHDPVDDIVFTDAERIFLDESQGIHNHRRAIGECLSQFIYLRSSGDANAMIQLLKARKIIDDLIRRYE